MPRVRIWLVNVTMYTCSAIPRSKIQDFFPKKNPSTYTQAFQGHLVIVLSLPPKNSHCFLLPVNQNVITESNIVSSLFMGFLTFCFYFSVKCLLFYTVSTRLIKKF